MLYRLHMYFERLRTIRVSGPGQAWLGLVLPGLALSASAPLGWARPTPGSVALWLASARLASPLLGPARLGPARLGLGSTGLGSARLGAARLGFASQNA